MKVSLYCSGRCSLVNQYLQCKCCQCTFLQTMNKMKLSLNSDNDNVVGQIQQTLGEG